MTSIGPIVRETPVVGRTPRRSESAAPVEAKQTGRELVPVAALPPLAEDGRKSMRRNSASFLAQLIANERQMPQTRERRRAEPQDALAAYGAAAKLVRHKR
jgi:hypothetical protein